MNLFFKISVFLCVSVSVANAMEQQESASKKLKTQAALEGSVKTPSSLVEQALAAAAKYVRKGEIPQEHVEMLPSNYRHAVQLLSEIDFSKNELQELTRKLSEIRPLRAQVIGKELFEKIITNEQLAQKIQQLLYQEQLSKMVAKDFIVYGVRQALAKQFNPSTPFKKQQEIAEKISAVKDLVPEVVREALDTQEIVKLLLAQAAVHYLKLSDYYYNNYEKFDCNVTLKQNIIQKNHALTYINQILQHTSNINFAKLLFDEDADAINYLIFQQIGGGSIGKTMDDIIGGLYRWKDVLGLIADYSLFKSLEPYILVGDNRIIRDNRLQLAHSIADNDAWFFALQHYSEYNPCIYPLLAEWLVHAWKITKEIVESVLDEVEPEILDDDALGQTKDAIITNFLTAEDMIEFFIQKKIHVEPFLKELRNILFGEGEESE